MAEPIFSSGSAIKRAKPLFELSEEVLDAGAARAARSPFVKFGPLVTEKPVVPFDTEAIFSSLANHRALPELTAKGGPAQSSRIDDGQFDLFDLALELADFQDLSSEASPSAAATTPANCEADELDIPASTDTFPVNPSSELFPRCCTSPLLISVSRDAKSVGDATPRVRLSTAPARAPVSLSPIRGSRQKAKGGYLASITRLTTPRVQQKYQLRRSDDLIAEANERRRIADELVQLENHRRYKEAELAWLAKLEKEEAAKREQALKTLRTSTAFPKKIAERCDPPFSDALLQ